MIKVWKADTETEHVYTNAALLNPRDFLDVKTMTGEPLLGRFPTPRIRVDSEYLPADYFQAGPLFMVSEKLKSVLQEFSLRVELHPVDVDFRGAAPVDPRYYFLNILDEAACLDRTASKYSEMKGYVGDIKKLVIDETKTVGMNLFRLAKAYQFIVLVGEPLAHAIQSSGVRGVRLIEPSAFRW